MLREQCLQLQPERVHVLHGYDRALRILGLSQGLYASRLYVGICVKVAIQHGTYRGTDNTVTWRAKHTLADVAHGTGIVFMLLDIRVASQCMWHVHHRASMRVNPVWVLWRWSNGMLRC